MATDLLGGGSSSGGRNLLDDTPAPAPKTETEKIAKQAAARRVSFQEKRPEPRITRTICARSTIKRKVAGIDQKTIALEADFKCSLK